MIHLGIGTTNGYVIMSSGFTFQVDPKTVIISSKDKAIDAKIFDASDMGLMFQNDGKGKLAFVAKLTD
jgi:hypothetical protein